MRELFDLHTHILPRMDDGSRSSGEAIDMLMSLKAQGVTDAVLTPHFYARKDEPDRFMQNRNDILRHLIKRISQNVPQNEIAERLPRLYLGAEVAFFNAMSNVSVLREMCISGTDLLLVEMPFERWTEAMAGELAELKKKQRITPVIAHIDRYFGLYKEPMLDRLTDCGVKIQINAASFVHLLTRRRAIGLLKSGKLDFIGSDCHNMEKRAPNINSALLEIEKRAGAGASNAFFESSAELLRSAEPVFCEGKS